MVVAIDGPAGAGKSTVARAVAQALGFRYLDTGAMYRAAALAGGELARIGVDPEGAVTVDGAPAGPELRSPQTSERASALAADPAVRTGLVARQQQVVADGDWVAEGRDIATVVAPDAAVKVFLTAAAEERARRRAQQTGEDVAAVLAAQQARDEQDSGHGRTTSAAAPGAIEVDTTGLAVDEVVAAIVALVPR